MTLAGGGGGCQAGAVEAWLAVAVRLKPDLRGLEGRGARYLCYNRLVDEHTLRVLEFDKVLAKLARHTSFSAGRELALALRPSPERAVVVRRQRVTAEARRLRELSAFGGRVGL